MPVHDSRQPDLTLLLKFSLPDLESRCAHTWGRFSEARPYTHNSVESTYPSAVLNICSTVVENEPWPPVPTYFELWAKKTAKKPQNSFQTLPSVAVNMHQLHYPSFQYFGFRLLPPKSRHMGKEEGTVKIHPNTQSHILNNNNESLCAKLTERHVSMPDF